MQFFFHTWVVSPDIPCTGATIVERKFRTWAKQAGYISVLIIPIVSEMGSFSKPTVCTIKRDGLSILDCANIL